MDNKDRLNLQKMINANDVEDFTDDIREKKHSEPIKQDLRTMVILKKINADLAKNDPGAFETICIERCQFLFNNYTDIFNKIRKDEIDLGIFLNFIELLKMIEDGKLDQHEASFQVGNLLKQIYIDSALRKSKHLDEANDNGEVE
ncbi:MAG: hypothetical protein WD512_18980, partial [Candidatus Paceibacterota bacterium]